MDLGLSVPNLAIQKSTRTARDSAAVCHAIPVGWRGSYGLGPVTPAAVGTRDADAGGGPEGPVCWSHCVTLLARRLAVFADKARNKQVQI